MGTPEDNTTKVEEMSKVAEMGKLEEAQVSEDCGTRCSSVTDDTLAPSGLAEEKLRRCHMHRIKCTVALKVGLVTFIGILLVSLVVTFALKAQDFDTSEKVLTVERSVGLRDQDVPCANVRERGECTFITMWYNASTTYCDRNSCSASDENMGVHMSREEFEVFENTGCYRMNGTCPCSDPVLSSVCESKDICASLDLLREKTDGVIANWRWSCDGGKATITSGNADSDLPIVEERWEATLILTRFGEVATQHVNISTQELEERSFIALGEIVFVFQYNKDCGNINLDVCEDTNVVRVEWPLPCDYIMFCEDEGLDPRNSSAANTYCETTRSR